MDLIAFPIHPLSIPILVKLFDAFNMRLRAQNYRKWKPSITVKERYAYIIGMFILEVCKSSQETL